jgi:hypothetical protein
MAKSSVVMKRWFDEVWARGRDEAVDELFAKDGLAHGLGDAPVRGPAEFRAFRDAFRATFRDVAIEIESTVDEGPMTYVRCVGRMTYQGKPVTLRGGCQCRIEGGKIAECWNQWDFVGLLVQMGALPADALARAFAGERATFAAAGRTGTSPRGAAHRPS